MVASNVWKELKQMYNRNKVESYNECRTFMSGTRGTPMFPNGLVFEGVNNDQPLQLYGPSAAHDLYLPVMDRAFGLQQHFPDNALTRLLKTYKAHIPVKHNEYLEQLLERVEDSDLLNFIKNDATSYSLYIQNLEYICKFRTTHFNFVKEYILKREKVSKGSGGANATSFMSNQLETVLDFVIDLCNHFYKMHD